MVSDMCAAVRRLRRYAPSRCQASRTATARGSASANVIHDRRDRAARYTTKRHPSFLDMIVKLRRVLIAAQYQPEVPGQPSNEEIGAVHLARAKLENHRHTRGLVHRCYSSGFCG
jgi:hypothetical protein